MKSTCCSSEKAISVKEMMAVAPIGTLNSASEYSVISICGGGGGRKQYKGGREGGRREGTGQKEGM